MIVDLSHLFDVLKLHDPKPPVAGLLDANGDGRDDRILRHCSVVGHPNDEGLRWIPSGD